MIGSIAAPTGHVPGTPAEVTRLDIEAVAARTLTAAQGGLAAAVNDGCLRHTFFLLTQVALAARQPEWVDRLAALGIALSPDATVFDLTAEFQAAIDARPAPGHSDTDVGEMARRAAGEALSSTAGPRAQTLFGNSGEELRAAVRSLATKTGFGVLAQAFFGRFMARFLNFYLSRVTASQVGSSLLRRVADVSAFNRALETHCHESARILRDFAGEWFSKTEYVEGITPRSAGGFVAVALQKLRAELQHQQDAQ